MSVIELIGFVVTMLALIFLFGKQSYDERKKRKDPEGYRREQERKQKVLDEFMRNLQGEEESVNQSIAIEEEEEIEEWEEEPLQPLPTIILKETVLQEKKSTTKLNQLVRSLPSKKDIPVMHALFGPPKSLE